jgi:Protein of unknown function (DUF5661)
MTQILWCPGVKMKKEAFPRIAALVIMAFALILSMNSDGMSGQVQPELRQSVEQKFEQYRTALKEEHQIDIKNFKDRIPGGVADGKPITNYDLGQLILGIKWERAHTNKDNMLALELAMDHLELIPDYYTRIERLEWECRSEKLQDM